MSQSHHTATQQDIEVLHDFYQQFLDRLWSAISSLLGDTATAALFHAARRDMVKTHPFLSRLDIQEEGVRLPPAEGISVKRTQLIQAYLDYLETLQSSLLDLTGGVVTSKLEPLITEFKLMMARGKESGTKEG